jgi:hypothetical protein
MRHRSFERGLDEIRAGEALDTLMDCWFYERGRLFGAIAPRDMPLKIGGNLNPKAVKLYAAASSRHLIP